MGGKIDRHLKFLKDIVLIILGILDLLLISECHIIVQKKYILKYIKVMLFRVTDLKLNDLMYLIFIFLNNLRKR